MKFQEMLDLLHGGDGINLDTFNRVGFKSLEELHEEVETLDVRLIKVENEIWRVAYSVGASVTCGPEMKRYIEFMKEFQNGKRLAVEKDTTVTETRKLDETPIQAILRCFREEVDIEVDPLLIKLLFHKGESFYRGAEQLSVHPSSVYPGLKSVVTSSNYSLHLPVAPPRLSREK